MAAGGFAAERSAGGDSDRQLRARCKRSAAGAPAIGSKCGQRHVVSRRRLAITLRRRR